MSSELNVNIRSIGGTAVTADLPVKVQNTVDVDVKGLNGRTMEILHFCG